MKMIKVEGIGEVDRAVALAALYNASKPAGMGIIHYDPTPMTVGDAQALLDKPGRHYFDYFKGRLMKVDLDAPLLHLGLYDRDLGDGAGVRAIRTVVGK